MLGALLPGIEARLQEQQHHQQPYPDPHHNNNVNSDDGATTAAYRFAARLLPALWRLAAALAADPSPSPAASALARPLAALIGRAEGVLLVSCASATPTARVRLLASLARQQHQQHLREEDGSDEAAAAAAAAAAFMRQLAESNLQGLVGGEGIDMLDGDALAALFGALARTGVEPLRNAAAASALEARARALLPAMPLPTLARFATGVMRCCAGGHGVYAPSASLVQAVAAALRGRLEGLAALGEEADEVPVACWSQVGEAMHALSVLRDGASGPTGGYDAACFCLVCHTTHIKKRPYRSLTPPKSHQLNTTPQQARRSSPQPPASRP